MKHSKSKFKLLTLFILVSTLNCAINYREIKSKDNVTVAIVLNDQWIELINRHRQPDQPYLKLSLTGAKIENIETRDGNLWTLQLDDKTTVDLTIQDKSNNVTEYRLLWNDGGGQRALCFHYGYNNASWYNSYQSVDQTWPMDTARKIPRTNFNHINNWDNIVEHYCILEHLFVISDGFALILNPDLPWFIQRDPQMQDPVMCFSVNNVFPYPAKNANNLNLDIRLLASSNIRTATEYAQRNWIAQPSHIPDQNRFVYPSIFTGTGKQDETLKLAHEIKQKGFENVELILYNWAKNGSIELFDATAFPTVDNMTLDITKLNYRTALQLTPQITSAHTATQQYVLKDNNSKLTSIVDLTNPSACDWYETTLKKLQFEYNIKLFHLQSNSLAQMKMFNETSPNLFIKNYVYTVSNVGSVSSYFAFKVQHLPVMIVPALARTDEQVLRRLIPNALSISLGGYSFLSAYLIGNGIPEQNKEEIFIRWTQAASLMPFMSFGHMPLEYGENVIEMMKKFIHLHSEHGPIIIELAKKQLTDGSPIIRPMWYAEPDNAITYSIDDQFMLGDDIVVAPVLNVGQRERSVYLPAGQWIDQHGVTYSGPGAIKVKAPLEELPYFKRKTI